MSVDNGSISWTVQLCSKSKVSSGLLQEFFFFFKEKHSAEINVPLAYLFACEHTVLDNAVTSTKPDPASREIQSIKVRPPFLVCGRNVDVEIFCSACSFQ